MEYTTQLMITNHIIMTQKDYGAKTKWYNKDAPVNLEVERK